MTSSFMQLRIEPLQRSNRVQSTLMVVGMVLILGICGFVMSGWAGLAGALAVAVVILLTSARVSPPVVLRGYKAVPLAAAQAPGLVQALAALTRRAGLSSMPKLYYVPSKVLNAFAVGRGEEASIALTDGLLRQLSEREIIGVLAHELSHIRHNDLFVMGLADAFSRVTTLVGQVGQVMVLLAIPSLFMGYAFPWLPALVLLAAPAANALLQLALSRSREHEADFGAAQLTGDPIGLAMALQKIEGVHGNWFEKVLMPGRREASPALLRTHPKTQDRVQRLQAYAEQQFPQAVATSLLSPQPLMRLPTGAVRKPRWHLTSFWY